MKILIAVCALALLTASAGAQISTDLFIMPGSDFSRPGLKPRSNLNIGVGITLGALKRVPVGDELTFGYTYENVGSHGFWHTNYGAHTETLGLMKNFAIPGTASLGGYTWQEIGLTSLTGSPKGIQNRLYTGSSIGLTYHFTKRQGVWLQKSYNKVETVPWYTSTSVGYVLSW